MKLSEDQTEITIKDKKIILLQKSMILINEGVSFNKSIINLSS